MSAWRVWARAWTPSAAQPNSKHQYFISGSDWMRSLAFLLPYLPLPSAQAQQQQWIRKSKKNPKKNKLPHWKIAGRLLAAAWRTNVTSWCEDRQPSMKYRSARSAAAIRPGSWKRTSVSPVRSVLMLSNTKQMFVRRSEAGTANVSVESLLEAFPDCSCRHVQLNFVHPKPPLLSSPRRQYLCAIIIIIKKSMSGQNQKCVRPCSGGTVFFSLFVLSCCPF